ncbi:50S ribosomal protein L16 [bacterium]|nr:50S ribosomal protein L16 [bacterium]
MPLLEPKRTKYRKAHRGRNRGKSIRGNRLAYGEFGVRALGNGRMTSRQIEAIRVLLRRRIGSLGKMWIRVFPALPITKKPLETRMGKGKGAVDSYEARVRRGRILFELAGVPRAIAVEALSKVRYKMNIPTDVVTLRSEEGRPWR